MQFIELIKVLKTQIAEDMTTSFVVVEKILKDDYLNYNEFIGLKSRNNDFLRKERKGILSQDEEVLQKNKIRNNFISFIDILKKEDIRWGIANSLFKSDNVNSTKPQLLSGIISLIDNEKSQIKFYFSSIYFIICIGIILGILSFALDWTNNVGVILGFIFIMSISIFPSLEVIKRKDKVKALSVINELIHNSDKDSILEGQVEKLVVEFLRKMLKI